MKSFIEGLFLCLGVGLYYLSASAHDTGHTGWALWLFVSGSCLLVMFLMIVATNVPDTRKNNVRHYRRK